MNAESQPKQVRPVRPTGMQTGRRTKASLGSLAPQDLPPNVCVVVEYGFTPTTVLPLLEALPALLPLGVAGLTLVHAEYDWLNVPADFADEAQAIGEQLAQRERSLCQANHAVRQKLQELGFSVNRELELATSKQNPKALLQQLGLTEQDLLIFLQRPVQGEWARLSPLAYALTTQAACSVLILRAPLERSADSLKIWLGVDASEASMTLCRKLTRYLGRAQSVPVSLLTIQAPVYQENALLAPFVNQSVLDEALHSNAQMIFEMCQDVLEAHGVQVAHRRRLLGSPASELGAVAEAEGPDLIAVGSHNRKGMLAWVLGSVSSQLSQWDEHNLLIVR